ncbi:MAG TPA: hypothetical protein DHV13_05120 [Helicobacter sp.]|nr:hypothetical protein [Helicobacter sp.]
MTLLFESMRNLSHSLAPNSHKTESSKQFSSSLLDLFKTRSKAIISKSPPLIYWNKKCFYP